MHEGDGAPVGGMVMLYHITTIDVQLASVVKLQQVLHLSLFQDLYSLLFLSESRILVL
jgi:hypothetical protein